MREFLRVTNLTKTRREEGEAEGAPPLFFVNIASKGLKVSVSCLESAFTGDCVSVASTGVTGEARIKEFRLVSGMLAAGARGVLDGEGSESREGKQKVGNLREGEGDGVRVEPNMKHFTMVSYHLSIVFVVTQKVIRTGRDGFEGEWRKSRGLRELAGLRRFGETVEMCGKGERVH